MGEDAWRYDPNVGAEMDPSLVPGARVVIVKGKLCVGVEGIVLGVATGDEMSMVCESRFEDSFGVLLKEQDGSVTILLPGDQYRVLPDPQQRRCDLKQHPSPPSQTSLNFHFELK